MKLFPIRERRAWRRAARCCAARWRQRGWVKSVAVVTQMAPTDQNILESHAGKMVLHVHVIPSAETTYMKVVHPSADVDERQIFQLANAGFFSLADLPPLAARRVHLAGITDQEFDLDFIRGLKERGYCLSMDMQSFVRQVDPVTHRLHSRMCQPRRKSSARWIWSSWILWKPKY